VSGRGVGAAEEGHGVTGMEDTRIASDGNICQGKPEGEKVGN
jgi:hypothetical protein